MGARASVWHGMAWHLIDARTMVLGECAVCWCMCVCLMYGHFLSFNFQSKSMHIQCLNCWSVSPNHRSVAFSVVFHFLAWNPPASTTTTKKQLIIQNQIIWMWQKQNKNVRSVPHSIHRWNCKRALNFSCGYYLCYLFPFWLAVASDRVHLYRDAPHHSYHLRLPVQTDPHIVSIKFRGREKNIQN